MEQETAKVIVESDASVAQWASRLGCSPARLRQAIQQVGPELADIREYLALARMTSDPPAFQAPASQPRQANGPAVYSPSKRAWD